MKRKKWIVLGLAALAYAAFCLYLAGPEDDSDPYGE